MQGKEIVAIIKTTVKDQGDMEGFLLNTFNTQPNPVIKKIDIRSYQGGFKINIKTVEEKE